MPTTTALVALLFNLTVSASPATATTAYNAVASGDWTSPATWAGGITPPLAMTGGDFVTIQAGLTVTISPSTAVTDGGFIVNYGRLVVAGTLDVQYSLYNSLSSLTVNAGGTLTVGGPSLPSIQNIGSTLTNHGTFGVRAGGRLMNQNGALVESDGILEVFGGGTINNLDVSRITNDAAGTMTNDSGAYFYTTAQITNNGSFTNQVGATFTNYGGVTSFGSITNHGPFDVVGNGGVVTFGSFGNDGALTVYANNGFLNMHGATFINAPGGTVTVRGIPLGFTNEGVVQNQNGATFSVWTGLLNSVGTFANYGQVITPNVATITNDGNGRMTNYDSGVIDISRYATLVNGDTTYGGGTINSYGTLTNEGQIQVAIGFFHQYAPGAITNGAGARITVASGSGLIIDSGVVLTNARFGTIANSGLVQNLSGAIENHGSIASTSPGFLSNGGTVRDYCADGATVIGSVLGNPVQGIGCTTTFTQTGIPSAGWGVTANGTHYTGSGASIAVNGLIGTVNYGYDSTIISGGTRYDCIVGCNGSVAAGGTASASYGVSYRVHFQATGCALPVPVPGDQWVAPGNAPSVYFTGSVYSTDDATSIICTYVSDDRPASITGPTTITATYQTWYLLTVQNGLSGSQSYDLAGTPVTLIADSVPGMIFIDWQVDATMYPAFVGTITFTMDAPHTATAVYETPAQATQSLLDTVNGAGLAAGITQPLDAKLSAAIAALARGSNSAAVGQIGAFVNAVQAQSGKAIPTGEAALLTTAAQTILAALH